jgi:hypothetical protein
MSDSYANWTWAQLRAEVERLQDDLMACVARAEVGGGIVNYTIEKLRAEVARLTAELQRGQNLADHPDFQKVSQRAEQAEAALAEAQEGEQVALRQRDTATRERDTYKFSLDNIDGDTRYAALKARVTALEGLLREDAVQWSYGMAGSQCPVCKGRRYSKGHQATCRLKAALDTEMRHCARGELMAALDAGGGK